MLLPESPHGPSVPGSCCVDDAETVEFPHRPRPEPGRPTSLPGFLFVGGPVSVFPVFLKLAGRRVLVVGGGPVAAGKLRALLDAHAQVTVVAPDIIDAIVSADVEL